MADLPVAPGSAPLVLFPVRLEVRSQYPDGQAGGPTLFVRIFPDAIHVDPQSATKGPAVARSLPDRFLVRVLQGGRSFEQLGELVGGTADPVTRRVAMGLAGADGPFEPGTKGIPGALQWITDFAAAEAIGLGVRVKLEPTPFASSRSW